MRPVVCSGRLACHSSNLIVTRAHRSDMNIAALLHLAHARSVASSGCKSGKSGHGLVAPAAERSCHADRTGHRPQWLRQWPQHACASRSPGVPAQTSCPSCPPWPHGAWASLHCMHIIVKHVPVRFIFEHDHLVRPPMIVRSNPG